MTLSSRANTAKTGLHIVTGGVLFQQALIVFFACCTFSISRKLRASVTDNFLRTKVHRQIYALQGSLCFISVCFLLSFHLGLAINFQSTELYSVLSNSQQSKVAVSANTLTPTNGQYTYSTLVQCCLPSV